MVKETIYFQKSHQLSNSLELKKMDKELMNVYKKISKLESLISDIKRDMDRIKTINSKPSDNNDFIQDPFIAQIIELQKDPTFMKEVNDFIKKHTS